MYTGDKADCLLIVLNVSCSLHRRDPSDPHAHSHSSKKLLDESSDSPNNPNNPGNPSENEEDNDKNSLKAWGKFQRLLIAGDLFG